MLNKLITTLPNGKFNTDLELSLTTHTSDCDYLIKDLNTSELAVFDKNGKKVMTISKTKYPKFANWIKWERPQFELYETTTETKQPDLNNNSQEIIVKNEFLNSLEDILKETNKSICLTSEGELCFTDKEDQMDYIPIPVRNQLLKMDYEEFKRQVEYIRTEIARTSKSRKYTVYLKTIKDYYLRFIIKAKSLNYCLLNISDYLAYKRKDDDFLAIDLISKLPLNAEYLLKETEKRDFILYRINPEFDSNSKGIKIIESDTGKRIGIKTTEDWWNNLKELKETLYEEGVKMNFKNKDEAIDKLYKVLRDTNTFLDLDLEDCKIGARINNHGNMDHYISGNFANFFVTLNNEQAIKLVETIIPIIQREFDPEHTVTTNVCLVTSVLPDLNYCYEQPNNKELPEMENLILSEIKVKDGYKYETYVSHDGKRKFIAKYKLEEFKEIETNITNIYSKFKENKKLTNEENGYVIQYIENKISNKKSISNEEMRLFIIAIYSRICWILNAVKTFPDLSSKLDEVFDTVNEYLNTAKKVGYLKDFHTVLFNGIELYMADESKEDHMNLVDDLHLVFTMLLSKLTVATTEEYQKSNTVPEG